MTPRQKREILAMPDIATLEPVSADDVFVISFPFELADGQAEEARARALKVLGPDAKVLVVGCGGFVRRLPSPRR